jgi:RNA polymerase-binding protein DksA
MTNKKLIFSNDFLEKIRAALLEEKARLEKELPSVSDSSQESGAFPSYGDKEDENAAEVAEYAANLTLEETLAKSLRDVKQSLKRLEAGSYGICKYCKKPIEEKRLLARPTSSACVECKKTIIQEI